MKSSYIGLMRRAVLVAIATVDTASSPVIAQDRLSERLSDSIKQIEAREPAYGHELRRLANEVASVRTALDVCVAEGADAARLADLWRWNYILPRAFQSTGSDFNQFKQKWPLIVSRSKVLCAMVDEAGNKHLIYCPSGVPTGPKELVSTIASFMVTGETGAEFQTDSEADRWAVESSDKGDVLMLIRQHPVNRDVMKMPVRMQKLRINKNSSFELIEDTTVEFPWPPNMPDDGTYTPAYPAFKYPEPYDTKAPAPLPAGEKKTSDVPLAPANAAAPAEPTPSAVVPTVAAPKAPTPPATVPTSEQSSSTPWSVVVVMIAAALGLLWLVLKRRS